MTKARAGYIRLPVQFAVARHPVDASQVGRLADEYGLDEAVLLEVVAQARADFWLGMQANQVADSARIQGFFDQVSILKDVWTKLSFSERRSLFAFRILDTSAPDQKIF